MTAKTSFFKSDEFSAVMFRCLIGMVIAVALGCFIGYGVLMMIGQDSDLTISQRYLDRSYATRAGFVTQNLEYQQAADALRSHSGLRVLRTASGAPLYWQDGEKIEPETLMDAEFVDAIERLFADSAEALSGQEDVTQTEITDLVLHNIAVDELGNVYYYLYYDALGYLCVIYDSSNSYAEDRHAVALMDQWYMLFNYEGLDV